MNTDTLVSGLYAAANGRAEWGDVLSGVADHCGLWLIHIVSMDTRTGRLLFDAYGGPGRTPEAGLDYVRFYNTVDSRIPLVLATPPEGWMFSHQHHDADFVANDPFYRDFLAPHGGGAVCSTRVVDVGQVRLLLGLVSRHGVKPLDPATLAFLPQLMHHLGEAFRDMAHLRETHAELDMVRGLMGAFHYPMLLVDEARRLWHQNPPAAALMAGSELFEERDGCVVFRRDEDDQAMSRALRNLSREGVRTAAGGARQVVPLRTTGGVPYLAFASAVVPEQTMGAFGSVPRALVVLHDPAQGRPGSDPFILAECFGLTPAEARVAVQIASGASAKEIAQRSRAAVATVRTHIQNIMDKTGVDRQPDLIRLLHDLPVRAA